MRPGAFPLSRELEPHYGGAPLSERGPVTRQPIHVVLDNIRSAYNVGSIFRSSDAGAVEHIHLCGMCAHPPHKKLEKTALGAFEYVPWTYYERTVDALDALGERGIHRLAIETTEQGCKITECPLPKPVAIVFGNEVTGINQRVMRRCDAAAYIPMMGFKNSMNVATAFGVVLYEVLRRWNVT